MSSNIDRAHVDVSTVFHAVGQPTGGRYSVMGDLWRALEPHEEVLPAFARVGADVLCGRAEPYVTTAEATFRCWVQFPGRARAFRFDGRWVLARVVSESHCVFELASEEEVRIHGIAELDAALLDMEALGLVRRVGMRNGKILWTAVEPS